MNTTRIIEAYLEGSLERDLADEIRIRAENDVELAELIQLHREVNESICDDELRNLRFTLKKIAVERNITHNNEIFPYRRVFRIAAACFFLLLIASAVKKWGFAGPSDAAIFKKYYVRYEPDIITRSENAAASGLEMAQLFYKTRDYDKSAAILSEITYTDRKNYMAWFYAGLVRIELNQPAEAARNFLKIPPDWNSPFRIHRNWYLALCLIKTGHAKEAGPLLLYLSAGNKFYSERAAKVLKEIRI
jgi:hypothetical protein